MFTGIETKNQPQTDMMTIEPIIGAGTLPALQQFVTATKLHPILVNFTAALVPVSIASDLAGRLRKDESLRHTAWWTLLVAMALTPFTALAGWLFWMHDDNGVLGMAIHKWLGTGLVGLLLGLFLWRLNLHRQRRTVTAPYLVAGGFLVVVLVVQGYLGGHQVFSGM